MTVEFSEPPPKGSPGVEQFTESLRQHPGEWAVWTESAPSSLVTRIKQGIASGFGPPGAYDATGRINSPASDSHRKYKVWVRYIGDD